MLELVKALKCIEDEISHAKNETRKTANLLIGTKKEIKSYEIKLKKSVKLKDLVSTEKIQALIQKLNIKLTQSEHELQSLTQKYHPEMLKALQQRKKVLESEIKKSNHQQKVTQQNASKDEAIAHYNQQRQAYLESAKNIITNIEQSFINLEYQLSTESLFRYFEKWNQQLPSATPIDTKAGAAIALLSDFFNSYIRAYKTNAQLLPSSQNIFSRFQLTFEKCKHYLNIAQQKATFEVNLKRYPSNQVNIATIPVVNFPHVLEHKDLTVIEHMLHPYLVSTLDQLGHENILSLEETERFKAQLDIERLNQYEQLINFDFDEFANSVQNSINSARRFKIKQGTIPTEYYMHLITSFSHEVKQLDDAIIPIKHDFYTFLDEEDKVSLVTIIKNMIALNNHYSGINIKVAASLQSKQPHSFALKQQIFDVCEKISHKAFYGLFITQIEKHQHYPNLFLQHFFAYICQITEQIGECSLIADRLSLLTQSMYWFVLNNSAYGGIALHNQYGRIQAVADRSLLQEGISEYDLVRHRIAPNLSFAHLLKDEYYTSYLLNHIDLRFKNMGEKYASRAEYQQHIAALAVDLREMRRLLVKNFKAADSIIDLELPLDRAESLAIDCPNGKIYALWQWETFGDGLGRICLGYDQKDMQRQAQKPSRIDATYQRVLRVNWNGLLSSVEAPWLDTSKMDAVSVEAAEDFNLYVLQKFHTLFIEQYAQTAQKIKQRLLERETNSTALTTETLIYDKQDYDEIYIQQSLNHIQEPDAKSFSSHTIFFNHGIKSKKFFKILSQHFNVVVEQGKGSEIKVHRLHEGGRIYRLGHHGAEVEYHASFIRKVLKRLNISLQEWSLAIQ